MTMYITKYSYLIAMVYCTCVYMCFPYVAMDLTPILLGSLPLAIVTARPLSPQEGGSLTLAPIISMTRAI